MKRPPAGLLLLGVLLGCGAHERSVVTLRASPVEGLTAEALTARLVALDLFEQNRNPRGRGIENRFEPQAAGTVLFDRATGLAWQSGGSPRALSFEQAEAYVATLNTERFAGFDDWRLPTVEEAASLLEPQRGPAGLHLDPRFGAERWWIWTADREGSVGRWVVFFYGGSCMLHVPLGGSTYARAVRTVSAVSGEP